MRSRAGKPIAILASVTYDELLTPLAPTAPPRAATATSAPPRPRLADLVPALDDRATANRRRRRDAVVDERKRARLAPRLGALLVQLDAGGPQV